MIGLVGYTGFVGSNLKEQLHFDFLYNSKNIEHIEQEKFDLVIYSGVKAEKYLANLNPQKDYMHIQDSINNIKKVKADTFVLISTIDVYKSPHRVTESDKIEEDGLHSYGLHRRQLEKWVQQNIRNYLIVRLPSIYGNNMKKNFIYDIKNLIPAMIRESKYQELLMNGHINLDLYYSPKPNGFFKLNNLSAYEYMKLKDYFENNSFNALSFTDERSIYQFYNLKYLGQHIYTALKNNIKIINLATEPLSAKEIFEYSKEKPFKNIIPNYLPAKYDMRTHHSRIFGGEKGYIFNKEAVLKDIKNFINEGE